MLSEVMILLFWVLLGTQNSATTSSLLLIPFSTAVMCNSYLLSSSSMMIFFLYVMVFIGGLLVLLVSLTSVLALEQMTSLKLFKAPLSLLTILFSTGLLLSSPLMESSFDKLNLFYWMSFQGSMALLVFLIFIISLSFITWTVTLMSSMSRST